ncbi:12390_t:CDS:10 [Entrophospora sp. SA101]|nr:12390_t:CDS:10 [Entrophospora sp. SA101]
MVSRLFGSNPFDESVEKATSETIQKGQEDLALNLEISDQIRSKQVQPKDAMRALKLASREFVDSLLGIVRSPASTSNNDVKEKLLGLIQTWALAFEGKPELVYVTETYRLLKHEGYVFPKVDKSTSIMMIDTATPPEWSDSDFCVRCRTPFTLLNRKHHCRNCGKTFCGECSSKSTTLPSIALCIFSLNRNKILIIYSASVDLADSKPVLNGPASTLHSNSATTNGNDTHTSQGSDEEDEDFKKAIELSLKETKNNKNNTRGEEEMDDDLAAAIAASLKDLKIDQSKYSTQTQYDHQSSSSAYPFDVPKDQNELSQIEADNIYKFSDLLEKIQQSGSDLIRDRQVQELYDRIGELKPKLTKNLTETIQRHQDLMEMHEKLSQVIKLYDRLLEDRMSNTYSRRTSNYAGTQRIISPVSSNAGIVYPSMQQPSSSLSSVNSYPQNPTYPLASAPSPSSAYIFAQTPLTQYTQPNALEIAPVLNQQLESQQIPYVSNAHLPNQTFLPISTNIITNDHGVINDDYNASLSPQSSAAINVQNFLPQNNVSYLPQPIFEPNSGYTQIQNPDYQQNDSSHLIVHQQQSQKFEEAPLIELN